MDGGHLMGFVVMPKPGTRLGPCRGRDCGHTDCAASRAAAEACCLWCGQPIGYDTPYFRDEACSAHAACAWAEQAARQARERRQAR
jgi:hypothetical protein